MRSSLGLFPALLAVGLTSAAALAQAPVAPAAKPARIELVTPTGVAKGVRQVAVRFSTPMVALGDPQLADPIIVACTPAAAGHGHWVDPRNWVFDFDADLDGGIRCQLDANASLRSAAAAPLSGTHHFEFSTGGPAILETLPAEGSEEIDQDQVFILKLDAAATDASIQAHAYCAVEGLADRVGVVVLSGAERTAVLQQRKQLGYEYFSLLFKNGEDETVRVRNHSLEQSEAQVVVLRCQRRLPAGGKVTLVWGRGIAAAGTGLMTSDPQRLEYAVREEFRAQVQCTRVNAKAGCVPGMPIEVHFSSPVPAATALTLQLSGSDGHSWPARAGGDFPSSMSQHGHGAGRAPGNKGTADAMPTLEQVTFDPPFAPNTDLKLALPPGFHDDADRPLVNGANFPVTVHVDDYPPLVKFSGTFGILEAKEGGVLPVTVRNVEASLATKQMALPGNMVRLPSDAAQVSEWLRRVDKSQEPGGEYNNADPPVWQESTGSRSVFGAKDTPTAFSLPKPLGSQPAEVVGIPLKDPGFYVVEIASPQLGASLLGAGRTRYVSTAALVTDLSVHFFWGREQSLLWVTHLQSGAPAGAAQVSINDACTGTLLWNGTTDNSGLATIAATLPAPQIYDGGCRSRQHPLMASAHLGDDFSFTLSTWDQGIRPGDFNMRFGDRAESRIAHTVFDRTLFHAGETVSMKHFLRQHVMAGMVVPGHVSGKHPVVIRHEGTDQKYRLDAQFDTNGQADMQWKIPAEAALGTYSVEVDKQTTGSFKVEQFRLPTMRGTVNGPATALVQPKQVPLDLHVAWLSGGSAGGLPVKLRTVVEARAEQFADYPDYKFGGSEVKEGIQTSDGRSDDLDFDSAVEGDDDEAGGSEGSQPKLRTQSLVLDKDGSAHVLLDGIPPTDEPSRLTAELEYADANGETLTSTGHVSLVPSALHLGISTEGWAGTTKQLRVRVIALDLMGKPVSGKQVALSLYRNQSYSYRKRLVGGFYAYETITETTRLKPSCSGVTNAQGMMLCELAPGVSGEIILRAQSQDPQGHVAGATQSAWVLGEDELWFGGTQGDRMDLLPEKKEYEVGDKARFQVRSPFRDATALVVVEREGVKRSFVTHLSGRTPTVEVPIENGDAPNIYVSVLAVRGRIAHASAEGAHVNEAAEITALVDLNKPAYRLGIAQIRVGWKPHRLNVAVDPARTVWRVRDHADVTLHITAADGTTLPAGTEVAIAAVDEALLDLSPNDSWNLLDAMMEERGLEVATATGQMQVIGKRHYGRKAVPHGGGGGRELGRARDQFDSLLLWNPRLVLDGSGIAHISVPLNDSLSSFRIVAIAHSGAQRFGTGSATVRTTQDLILLSGLPPVVREGDQLDATITVRNTTERTVQARVQASAAGLANALEPKLATLKAGQAQDLSWRITIPVGASHLDWHLVATDTADSKASGDNLKVVETVVSPTPVRTYQATIAQLTAPLSMPVQRPAQAIAGRGGLEVQLQRSLAASLDGVRDYMRNYPYNCFEQMASRAVVLEDRHQWDAVMARLPAYLDRDGLIRYFPSDNIPGDDSLTAYVLSIAHEAGWEIPESYRSRMLDALGRFVQGKLVRYSALDTADLAVRKIAALDALSRYGAAQAPMLDSLHIDTNLLPTSALLDLIGVLDHQADIPHHAERQQQALGVLRSRLNFQGTILRLSTERTDALWWLMISPDSNANRLLLAVLKREDWREDVPRLVRGAVERQRAGHWNTTVANAWGVLAMRKFSAAFEATAVTGATAIQYGSDQRSVPWPAGDGTKVSLPWQEGQGGLGIAHSGTGAPWALVKATAALPLLKPLSSGLTIQRTVTAVQQAKSGQWSRGDVVRVHLDLEAQADVTWLVVDDPVPAGASILGSGLGGQSALMQRGTGSRGWAWLAYEERRFDDYRAYYRFVPKGKWTLEYTLRLNNPGVFTLPASRIEAMYSPEMFGELPNAAVTVTPAP